MPSDLSGGTGQAQKRKSAKSPAIRGVLFQRARHIRGSVRGVGKTRHGRAACQPVMALQAWGEPGFTLLTVEARR